MKKTCLFFLTAIFAFPAFSFSEDDDRSPAEKIVPLVESTQKFSFAFYQEILKDHAEENLFFSPMNLHFGLSMTAMGAKGETQKQMLNALHLEKLTKAEKQRFREFGKYFRYNNQLLVYSMTNRFWHDPVSAIKPAFQKELKDYFDTAITPMNLKKQPEASRKAINKAIAEDTNQKIQDLLPPGFITKDTAFVLANAMIFRGKWASPFMWGKHYTRPESFFLADGAEKETPMMKHPGGEFFVYQEKTFQAVSLPYYTALGAWSRIRSEDDDEDDDDFWNDDSAWNKKITPESERRRASMIVLLPNEKTGLPAIEEKLSAKLWEKITGNMKERIVELKLPKFRIDTRLDLKACLGRMGITDAFIPPSLPHGADFTGASDSGLLFLQNAIHGAFVDVDEEGTEAVAVTVMETADEEDDFDDPQKIVKFHADHPFLFFIRDDATGAILFMGRFVSPP